MYQRIRLSDGSDVGQPGPLPAELAGLDEATLADLPLALDPAALAQLGYSDSGFVRAPDPTSRPPPPSRVISHYAFMSRFTSAERIAIRASADPIVVDLMDLMRMAAAVDLDAPSTQQGVGYLAQHGLLAAEREPAILA